jgi:hypothetical protein
MLASPPTPLAPHDSPSMRYSLHGGPMDGAKINDTRVVDGVFRRGISSTTTKIKGTGHPNIAPDVPDPLTVWDWDDYAPQYLVTYVLSDKGHMVFKTLTNSIEEHP